ncbi:MAG: hypothetical protein AAF333_16925 [Planctomycetota bacterium]
MPERYPTDAELLGLAQDADTGVDYIPTGRSPYYLEYRRSMHRLLEASRRANDLRVYADGDLSVGIRPGRCCIGDSPVVFNGQDGLAVAPASSTRLWLDAAGTVQASTGGLPADRSTFIPLAEVVTTANAIDQITDLRGEAYLQAPSAATLGLTASTQEINQALDGIASTVTPLALNQMTSGPYIGADNYHSHTQLVQNVPGVATFSISNHSFDPAADLALRFSLPELHPSDTVLRINPGHRFLDQSVGDTSFTIVGSTHQSFVHHGDLTTNQIDQPLGVVPLDGEVVAVVLSAAENLQSSNTGDGIDAVVKVNGVALITTAPALTSGDGAGFASTQRGDGTPAVIKTDGTEQVRRGDLFTLDLSRNVSGTVSTEARHPAVLVVIRAAQPE